VSPADKEIPDIEGLVVAHQGGRTIYYWCTDCERYHHHGWRIRDEG